MTYKFPPIFYKLLSFFMIKIIIILIIIGIILLIRYLFKAKIKDLYKYKINYHWLNWFLIIIYISFFIVFISYIRIKSIHSVDLNPFKDLIINTYKTLNTLDFSLLVIICILLLYTGLMLLKKVRTFFVKELIKRHLHIEHQSRTGLSKSAKFLFYYSYSEFTSKVSDFIIFGPLYKLFAYIGFDVRPYKRARLCLHWISYKILYLIKIIPFLLILILLIYDIYYHSWVITKIFYYLIPFMFYNLWKRYSDFIMNYDNLLGSMVYDMYYNTDKILYVNMPDEWENIIYEFVDNGLQQDPKDYIIDISKIYLIICTHHKHISTDGKKYKNSQGLCYMREDLT